MTDRITAADYRASVDTRERREDVIHVSILAYLRTVFPDAFIFHPKNESGIAIQDWWPMGVRSDVKRSIANSQQKAKRLGMVPGTPDLVLCIKGRFWAFEVKAEGGTVSKEQRAVGMAINACGGRWAVVRSIDDVQECISEWSEDFGLPIVGVVS